MSLKSLQGPLSDHRTLGVLESLFLLFFPCKTTGREWDAIFTSLLKSTKSAFFFCRHKEPRCSLEGKRRSFLTRVEREGETFSLCRSVYFEGKEGFSRVFSSTHNDGLINGLATFRSPALLPSFENDGYVEKKKMEVHIIFHTSEMKDSAIAMRFPLKKRTFISAINSLVITRN